LSKNDVHIIKEDPLKVERAFLVGVQIGGPTDTSMDEILNELAELSRTLGVEVVGRTQVKIRRPNSKLLVGKGKADELLDMARSCEADVIIFDDPLTPSQQRNWENFADLAVIDRQEVILDIFAARAQTKEATLQVSLAQANYSLPRLKRRWTHLHRQRGMKGGMGLRGEGEQQIEVDSRLVRDRIVQLKRQLVTVQQHRQTRRGKRRRKPVAVAAIVGYTNAGKSSLLNAMTSADVFVENKLFATLDATVRRVALPNRQELLLVDTVGFIRKLPHLLVEAFKSTLEETRFADFLIEVLDVAGSQIEEHHQTTREILTEIDATKKNVITVFNKIDLVHDPLTLRRLRRKYPDAVFISAKTGEGLDEFTDMLAQELETTLQQVELLIPHNRYDLVAKLHRSSAILEERHEAEGTLLKANVPREIFEHVKLFTLPSSM